MTEHKEYVEDKIKNIETQITNIKAGMKARTKLGKKQKAQKTELAEAREILTSAGKGVEFVDEVEEKLKEEMEQNTTILDTLKSYLKEHEMELSVYKKALETLI